MDFSALSAYLKEVGEIVPGYDCILRRGRETLFRQTQGVKPDGFYWFYSATKVFTCTAALRLIERGLLSLEDPVSRYLPEYAGLQVKEADGTLRPAKNPLLIRHLFSMQGGLTYDIFNREIREAEDRSTLGILKAVARMPLSFDPGENYQYSLCHDVLAGVVEAVSGLRFADYVKREITDPLGMGEDMCFHPTAAQLARMEPQYQWQGEDKPVLRTSLDNHFCFSDSYDSGGAGLCGTAEAYLLLSEALACGGRGRDGYPLLKPETIDLMRQNRQTGAALRSFRVYDHFKAYGYGLGVRTRVDRSDGSLCPVGEFGWDGAAGAYTLIEPGTEVSFVYFQHVRMMGPVYDIVHPRLRDLIWEGLKA